MKCLGPAVFLLCCLTALQPCFGQTINLDSLWGVWNDKSQPDTNRLKAMQKISWYGYLFSQPDSAFYFAQLQFNLAKTLDNKKQMAYALNTQGVSFYRRGDYAKAMDYYTRSLKIKKELGDKKGIANSLDNIGIIYNIRGETAKAIEYLTKSLKKREELGDKTGIASSLNNIGIIYKEQGNYEQALEYYDKSLNIDEEIGNKSEMAGSYHNIGNIYKEQGNYEQALEYYDKSLNIDEEIGNKSGIAGSYTSIGLIYHSQGETTKAIDYFSRSLKIQEELGDKKGIANSLSKIGIIYQDQGNFEQALAIGSEALLLAQEVGAVIEIKSASNLLYDVYKKTGQTAKALEMYELYIQMRDSIINEENTRALVQQEYKYQYEKEQAVADAKHKEEINLSAEREKRQQLISYGAGGGLVLVLAFAFLIYNRFKKIQRQKKVIQQKNKHITESITYARRIQRSILPSMGYIESCLNEFYILYKPKDIVSGDFYWVHEIDKDKVMVAICDCTGHGIPGAFMSMISTSLLNEIIIENGVTKVNAILDTMRTQLIKALRQHEDKVKARDGLDIALLLVDKKNRNIDFAGAGHKLYITGNEGCKEIKGDSYPVGYLFGKEKPFTMKKIQLDDNETIYLTSDGFTDQFGGKNRKKFGRPAFMQLLSSIKDETMAEQKTIVDKTIAEWKGNFEQIDDICVMGMRI